MIKLIVTGRLGKDSVLKFTANGNPVLNYSVATPVGFGDNKQTNWVNCSTRGKQAESPEPHLKKGTQVAITGDADLREWESDNGKGTSLDCSTDSVELMGSKPEAESKPSDGGFRKPIDARHEPTQDDFADDDIPF